MRARDRRRLRLTARPDAPVALYRSTASGTGHRDRTVRPCALVDWRGRTGLNGGMAGAVEPPRVWAVAGSYFEACNCEAVCPCRTVGERAGGRSTYGICQFALSWQISQGRADRLRLDDLGVVMAGWYDDDEPGSPWRVSLYLDERAGHEQHAALAAIFAPAPVACGIPGLDRPGQEVIAGTFRVDDAPLSWELHGRCGFATDFAYSSDD